LLNGEFFETFLGSRVLNRQEVFMNNDFNPPELEGRLFLTIQEFARIAGVTKACVYKWGQKGHLRLKKFSPNCRMVPRDEVLRYLRGEMMEPRSEN
jgi:hypothetical protein